MISVFSTICWGMSMKLNDTFLFRCLHEYFSPYSSFEWCRKWSNFLKKNPKLQIGLPSIHVCERQMLSAQNPSLVTIELNSRSIATHPPTKSYPNSTVSGIVLYIYWNAIHRTSKRNACATISHCWTMDWWEPKKRMELPGKCALLKQYVTYFYSFLLTLSNFVRIIWNTFFRAVER